MSARSAAMAFSEALFPSWMIPLYRCSEYFQSCEECWRSDGGGLLVKGKIPAKYQKNFFILSDGSLALACSNCKDIFTGRDTIRIQIRRSSHHDVVKYTDLQSISSGGAAGLQDYTINGNKVAFLTTRPVGRIDLRSPSCIVCQRELKDSNKLYCSLQCKHTSVDPHYHAIEEKIQANFSLPPPEFQLDISPEVCLQRRDHASDAPIVRRAEADERARHPRKQPRYAIRSGL